MKNKVINSILLVASLTAGAAAIAGAVLGCNYALILLAVPTLALAYTSFKAIKKVKLQKNLNN